MTSFPQEPIWRAVVDRMLPADQDLSGWAAGVGEFLQRTLSEPDSWPATDLLIGVDALGREAGSRHPGRTFPGLSAIEQDALLADLAAGRAVTPWLVPPAYFVDLVARMCAHGFYGDPGNGGNYQEVSWRMVGYRQLEPGVGWPRTEPAVGPVMDAHHIADHYDAVVVGAGGGGGAAAMVLAESGMRVLLLERGESLSSDRLPLDHLRNERSITGYQSMTGPGVGHPRVVVGPTGRRTVYAPDAAWSANATTVGGGTRVYGAQAWRFCPEDFRMAEIYGVPEGSSLADWPLSYDDLEPWYGKVEQELGVAGAEGGDRFAGPRSSAFPMPPLPQNLGSTRLTAAAARLGYLTCPVPMAINSQPFLGRPACVRCGACVGFACHAAAKNGTHNTFLPRAMATERCDLVTGTQATKIITNVDGRAASVELAGEHDGSIWRARVDADYVVIAAGAIETARLLLNSATTLEPDGLGNDHGHVGRHLQAHVYAGAIGLFDDVVQDSLGPGPAVATNDFRHANPGVVGGGMLANDFVPTPLNVWDTLSRLGVIDRFGAGSKAGMRRWWSRMQMIFGPAQELPNPESRVMVDPEIKDRFGVPVALLSGDIHPADRRTARMLAERAAAWLTAAGAHTVLPMTADERPEGPSGGQHQAGTARMGSEPTASVTDPWGRLWGHPNVLIADGSVHVTNGGVNPVLTILALAYRNSVHLTQEWIERHSGVSEPHQSLTSKDAG